MSFWEQVGCTHVMDGTRGTDATQGRRMPFISRLTKLPNMLSAATKEAAKSITPSQLVCFMDVTNSNIY